MKIIQITDLHVASETEYTHGVNVRQNFLDILKAAKSLEPDFLVLTGDLCYDIGEAPIYQWMKPHIDNIGIPYSVIGGNHDDSVLLANAFKVPHLLVGEELFFKRLFGEYTALFLETSKGFVSDAQLAWIDHELSKTDENLVIFMHHPPAISGVPHMDINYALQNMDAVQQVLSSYPRQVPIFCGHYHVEKTLCLRNLTIHITPSTYFQMDWHEETFRVDHLRIALREINLRNDGVVESTVVYYDGNRS
ncbi:MAG: metallophosphoesterase [Bacteroidota bacterium]